MTLFAILPRSERGSVRTVMQGKKRRLALVTMVALVSSTQGAAAVTHLFLASITRSGKPCSREFEADTAPHWRHKVPVFPVH